MTKRALVVALICLGGCSGGGSPARDSGADGGSPDTSPSEGGGACPTGGTGQLTVAVTGVDASAMLRLSIKGGTTTSMTLTAGTAVTLPSGPGYTIVTPRVKVAPAAGSIVGKAYYVSGNTFDGCIKSGGSVTATLTYMQEPGSGRLYVTVANAPTLGNEIAAFDGTAIAATATKEPALWKTMNFTGRGTNQAFDSAGNLWVAGGDRVNMYAMLTLATAGGAPPEVTLMQPDGTSANGVAFDASGNLWVARGMPGADSSLVRYGAADLTASGSPTPGVVLTGANLVNPTGLAFDSAGMLWVASQGNDRVLGFSTAHLGATSAADPEVMLTARSGGDVQGPYTEPSGLAFDQAGNLWVSFLAQIIKIPTAERATTHMVDAPLALNVGTQTLAFDETGGLWVTAAVGVGKFQRIPAAALATAGDVTGDIVINSDTLGDPERLVLDPGPTWSQLRER